MNYYKLYGKIIGSDLEFSELVPAKEVPVENLDVRIFKREMPEDMWDKNNHWEFGETSSWLSNFTLFMQVENGNMIQYAPKGDVELPSLKTFLLGFGLSMLHLQRGEMMFHCSVLSKGNHAILVAGESGSGKSTTTRNLLARGYDFMADDASVVRINEQGDVVVEAGFPYQKLTRMEALNHGYRLDELIYISEMKDKYYVPYEKEFSLEPKTVKALFVLGLHRDPLEELVAFDELSGMDKYYACVWNLFLRHLLEESKYSAEIGKHCLKIASKISIYVIRRPHEGDTINEIVNLVEEYSCQQFGEL